jgi:DNA-binding MarR family transcriptional regulator
VLTALNAGAILHTHLRVAVSHRDLANHLDASRPRVTEHLARLEGEGLVIIWVGNRLRLR